MNAASEAFTIKIFTAVLCPNTLKNVSKDTFNRELLWSYPIKKFRNKFTHAVL
jgi:hypothetical protein